MLVSWTYLTFNPIFNIRTGTESKNEYRHFVLGKNRPCGIFNSSLFPPPASFSVSVDLALTSQCFHNFREFSHWKVNSLATEKRDFLKAPLPLAPEFLRNLRLLGRRPTLQQINENLIKKYGTHFLVSATLGGKNWHDGLLICNVHRSRAKNQGAAHYSKGSSEGRKSLILPFSGSGQWEGSTFCLVGNNRLE